MCRLYFKNGGNLKILIACNHYPVASGRYVADAFRRLGHEVKTWGTSTQNNVWGISVDPKYNWVMNSADIDIATWPDLFIVMDSDPTVWKKTEQINPQCPVIVYGVDNHVRVYENDVFDHQFLAHYHGPAYPVDPARKDHSWIPCASDPMFTPSPIPWEKRGFDVACVGVMYPRRVELVNKLRAAGLSVFAETGLLYDEYRDAYWNARISLCVSAAGDVAQRVFETGRMGCAVLTDPLLDIMDEATNHDLGLQGYATYWSDDEAVTWAKSMLLGEPAFQVARGGNGVAPEALHEQTVTLGSGAAAAMAKSCYAHTWDARAQVIVDWFEREYGKDKPLKITSTNPDIIKPYQPNPNNHMFIVEDMREPEKPTRLPFLNIGCGRTHFPSEPPLGHEMVDPEIYRTGEWLNVDKVQGVGADKVFDLFAYPWPLEDNSFDGAVLGHIVEHIPHEIKMNLDALAQDWVGQSGTYKNPDMADKAYALQKMQDGWYAFFSELYRVLTPGAIAHIISPYGWSDGAITDPTHTRLLTINTFTHGLSASQYTGTFAYNIGCNFEMFSDPVYRFTPMAKPFLIDRDTTENALATRLNMVYDFYVRLKAVK